MSTAVDRRGATDMPKDILCLSAANKALHRRA
jgi:hypothetical protein